MLGLSAQNKSWRRSFCKFYVLGAISGERLLTMQLQCSLIVILLLCLQLQDGESIRLPQLPGFSWGRKACTDFHSKSQSGSVTLNADGDFQFSSDASEGGVAWGSFLDATHTASNFGQLRVTTSSEYTDSHQVYAAGFLEGYLTAQRIHENFENLYHYFTTTMGADLEQPIEWIMEQDQWVRNECERRTSISSTNRENNNHRGDPDDDDDPVSESRVWKAMCLAITQFHGVVAGYTARYKAQQELEKKMGGGGEGGGQGKLPYMSYNDFLFMESNADLYDVIDSMDPSQGPSWSPGGEDAPLDSKSLSNESAEGREERMRIAGAKLFNKLALSGKCSALVKVSEDLGDIYMGHATWDSYTAMLRIYKHYNFALKELRPATQRMSFSSYPGEVFSDDDFYLMDSGLVVLQTTNKIFNNELFDALTPHSALSWQRIRAANWLASSGEEWAQVLDTSNSGTYNNQYMVVDLNLFVPGENLRPGLLWVAEQIPGMVVSADMTPTLALGYWPSYNVPFFPEVYNKSGYPDFISKLEQYGQHFTASTHWLSYETSPRANIFRRDQASIASLDDMKRVMRSNNWKKDPLAEGRAVCAVCGRGDLDPEFPEARGCYDSKVTSYTLALNLEAEVVNGPTRNQGDLPAFQWKQFSLGVKGSDDLLHLGQPGKFDFKFERMVPEEPDQVCGVASA